MSRAGRRKAITTVFALGASVPFMAGARQPMQLAKLFGAGNETFEWLPTECADERYPMQLVQGDLYSGNERIRIPTGKIVNNGWGEIGSRRIVGERLKPVPERLELTWFSFAEDRFYGGSVALPRDELLELFRAGFSEPWTGERATWSKVIVGMGLGGWTSVWLAGSALVREVASARLATREVDWRRVLDNPAIARADYLRSKLQSRLGEAAAQRLIRDGPPVATWPRYAKRFRWRIAAEGVHAPLTLLLRTFNGERAFYDFARQAPAEQSSAPKHLQITWQPRSGRRLLTEIRLDEAEVFTTFDESASGSSTTLRVEFAARNRVALSVESAAGRIPLTQSSVKLNSLSS